MHKFKPNGNATNGDGGDLADVPVEDKNFLKKGFGGVTKVGGGAVNLVGKTGGGAINAAGKAGGGAISVAGKAAGAPVNLVTSATGVCVTLDRQ